MDPLKHQLKGRSLVKRLKSFTESGNSKSKGEQATDGSRKCGLCGGNDIIVAHVL